MLGYEVGDIYVAESSETVGDVAAIPLEQLGAFAQAGSFGRLRAGQTICLERLELIEDLEVAV